MTTKRFWNELRKSLLIEFFKYLIITLILNGGLFLILSNLSKYISLLDNQWLFWTIISLATLFSMTLLYGKFNKDIPYFPVIHSEFEILKLEVIHIVLEKDKYLHQRIYKLKAKRNGLGRYRGKFSWTGNNFNIRSGDNKHDVYLSKKINVFNTYIIDFNRTYNRNEIIDAIVEWDLFGEGSPFISCQIEEPTKELILKLQFDRGLKINTVEFEETYVQAAKGVITFNNIELENSCAIKKINNPKLLHLYEMRWKW